MIVQEQEDIQRQMQQIADNLIRKGILDEFFKYGDILIESIMERDVLTLDHIKSVYDAAMLMIQKGVGYVIVTAYGKPFGIVTERDIVCAIAGLRIPVRNLLLSILASRPLICVRPSQTIEEVVEIMRKYNIHRIPVVDKDQIVGIITTRDISMYLPLI